MYVSQRLNESRFAALDGLRGIAALAVALFHFQAFSGVQAFPGYLAVDLFFVMSGFVLSRAYEHRLREGLDPASFLKARIKRFLPLYLCGLMFGLMAVSTGALQSTLGTVGTATTIAFNAVMLPNPFAATLYPLNGASWSLFYELAINLALACWFWRARTALLSAVCLASLAVIVAVARGPEFLHMGWDWATAVGGIARTTFSFVLGIIVFRVYRDRAPRSSNWALLVPLLGLLPVLTPFLERYVWEFAYIILIGPLTVIAGVNFDAPSWSRAWLERLGGLSFPLYAIHWPLAPIVAFWTKGMAFGLAACIFLFVTVALSLMLEKFVDRPTQAFFKQRSTLAHKAFPLAEA